MRTTHDMGEPGRPSLSVFLKSRVVSGNGVASVLYIALAIWIARNPERARRLWWRLQEL